MLMSQASSRISASCSAPMRPAVSSVSGAATTTMSLARSTSSRRSSPCSSTFDASPAPRSGCRRVARMRDPNGARSRLSSTPMLPYPTMPIVSSDSSRPRSGCHVRSRCSSRSCGRRRAIASDIITTYSAIGRLKTPRAFVTVSPRSRTTDVVTRSTPAEAEWIQRRRAERVTTWSSTDAGTEPSRSTSASLKAVSSASPWMRPSAAICAQRTPSTDSIRLTRSRVSGAPRIGVARTVRVGESLRARPPRRA